MAHLSVGDILREQIFTKNYNGQLLLHRAAKRKKQTLEKVFFNTQLVFHTEMSDYSSSRQPVEEKSGEIYHRLEKLHNAKDQLKAEMALQTFSHKPCQGRDSSSGFSSN